MPIITCPNCPTKLRVPDGATGKVKCPKCQTVFSAAASASAPAFEVVDDNPTASPPPPPPPAKAKSDFEFDTAKPKAKVKASADFEVLDDEDEDDRPKSKRRRDRDDDDDDDDRPRKKKKRRRDDDDDDDDWHAAPRAASGGGMASAKVAMQLLSISLWTYLATFALLILFTLLSWLGVSIPNGLMILVGLIGLTNWILGLVGLGFSIAGPSRARGLAIAATVVASLHLIMAFVIATNTKAGVFNLRAIEFLSFVGIADKMQSLQKQIAETTDNAKRQKLFEEMREVSESAQKSYSSRGTSDMRWGDIATLLPYSDQFITVLSYQSKAFDEYILPLLGGLLEVARLILIILLIGSVANAAKAHDASGQMTPALIFAGVGAVVPMILLIILRSITEDSKPKSEGSIKSMAVWIALITLVMYGLHLAATVFPALMAGSTSAACRRRGR